MMVLTFFANVVLPTADSPKIAILQESMPRYVHCPVVAKALFYHKDSLVGCGFSCELFFRFAYMKYVKSRQFGTQGPDYPPSSSLT